MGNTNHKRMSKDEELEILIYKVLENNPRVNQDELHSYGVSEELLDQDETIVRQLHDLVAICNRMGGTRRMFLFKKLHGVNGKEMSLMLKKIALATESAEDMVADIVTANGICPALPVVFSALPDLIEFHVVEDSAAETAVEVLRRVLLKQFLCKKSGEEQLSLL